MIILHSCLALLLSAAMLVFVVLATIFLVALVADSLWTGVGVLIGLVLCWPIIRWTARSIRELASANTTVGQESAGTGGVEFPIADYDDLGVRQILQLLPRLYSDELDLVAERERSTKNRPIVVNRLEELRKGGTVDKPLVDGD